MAYYAQEAGIDLDPIQLENLETEVKNITKFHVNEEKNVIFLKFREEEVSSGDNIHALHSWLNKKQVYWKGKQEIYDASRHQDGLVEDKISKKVVNLLNEEKYSVA